MKKKFRKMTAVLLAMLLILLIHSSIIVSSAAFAGEAVGETEGRTGDCRWTLNALGTLTISGYGATGSDSSLYNYYFNYIGWNREDVKEIIISWGVTVIGEKLFAGLENVTSVSIPDSVTKIENSAFAGCSKLERITIPDSVTTIYSEVFKDCTSLQTAIIGDSVEEISYSTFENCSNLENLTIGESVKTIWDKAFAGCIKLSGRLTIPNSVTKICTYAFSGCAAISGLTIGNSVESIDDYAFVNCNSITTIGMPLSVKYIGVYAFHNCNKLGTIFYSGSKSGWLKIDISNYNTPLEKATKIYGNLSPHKIITSDYKDNHNFSFGTEEEIEDLVFSKASTEYNPRLAHFLACMARSAYTQDLVKSNYEILGFNDCNQYHYEDDGYAGFNIGTKQLDSGNSLILITIRGSNNDSDWQTDFNKELRESDLAIQIGIHTGFENCEIELYNILKDYFGGSILKNNVTYIINGHSLGGAVGNLLALRLFNDGVPNSNVYNYNYACPLVGAGPNDISAWNNNGEHNNIISINNWFDLVPSIDYRTTEQMKTFEENGWSRFKRFGVSYWFDNGFQFWWDAHDMSAYLDYLEKENDTSHFRDSEYIVQKVSAFCPVDIDIYDKQGNLIAGTVNNEPYYYGNEQSDKVVIFVNGDKKIAYILSDEQFEIRLHGTDTGTMDYCISTENITNSEIISQKWYTSVQLTDGKEMTGVVTNYLDTSDTQLFVTDKDKNKTHEILTDGTEVNPIIVSESKLNLKLDDTVILTAESEDDYRWFSTDESVATVENGVVTVRSFGKANIIAETVNGARAICKVIVPANCGDTDLDGKITISDVTEIQKYLAEFVQFTDEQLALADTDGDGKVDIKDATHLQKYLAEFDGIVLGKQS